MAKPKRPTSKTVSRKRTPARTAPTPRGVSARAATPRPILPSSGIDHVSGGCAEPLDTAVDAVDVTSPGIAAVNVNVTTSLGPSPAAASRLAYGLPPMAASRSGSANASMPLATLSVPLNPVVTASSVTLRCTVTACNGPLAPLTEASRAVACSAVVKLCRRVTVSPPPAVAVGPSTTQPAAFASSKRRSSASPGACSTTALSAVTVTVTEPEPSGATTRPTAVSTRQPVNTTAAATSAINRRM